MYLAYWNTGFRKPQAAYLTLPARLLMETRLICMGTSVAGLSVLLILWSSQAGEVQPLHHLGCPPHQRLTQ